MTAACDSDRIRLNDEDAARMRRLYEEISGRLEEMALVASRVLNRHLDGKTVRTLHPREHGNQKRDLQMQGIEFVYGPDGSCGVYDYDAGTCYPC